MDFDTIMREITSKLTGEPTHDIPYLQEQCQKYKEHELSTEILRACGRLTFQMIPEGKKESLTDLLEKNHVGFEAALEEAHFNIYKKKYDVALRIVEGIIEKIQNASVYTDDRVSEYHTFNETFEELLYRQIYQPEKDLRPADPTWTRAFFLQGNLLFEMQRYQEAQEALKRALRLNPVSTEINFEYIETYKVLGDMETFYQLSKEAFRYAFKSADVARCYRNIGFYFIEKEKYREAMGCFKMSTIYEASKTASSEMYYIHQVTQGKAELPSQEEMEQIAVKNGFPMGPDQDVLGMSYAFGKHAYDDGHKQVAQYFWSITYDLTGSDEIKALLNKCEVTE